MELTYYICILGTQSAAVRDARNLIGRQHIESVASVESVLTIAALEALLQVRAEVLHNFAW